MNKANTLALVLGAIAVLTPQPANAAIARFFGWKYSDNETYQKIEEWVDTSGKVLGLVGVIAPPAASVGAVIKTTVIVAKIVDPPSEKILSGRVTVDFDPSYELAYTGWYGEFGANPLLPAPPINSSSFDQTLLQANANPAMKSSSISINQTNGRSIFEFDWGATGLLPTLNQDVNGHFNILGMYFRPSSPISESLVGTSPQTYIGSIVGSQADIQANGTKASSYLLCSGGYCGDAVPEPLTILGAATAIGFGTVFKRRWTQVTKENKNS